MNAFRAVYYRDAEGREPVADFVDRHPPKVRAALKNQMGRLNLLSDDLPHLPFPHSTKLRDELRELRCHWGREHVRIIYARSDRLLVLLHVFTKTTAKVPESEIAVADERWHDFRARMNSQPRKHPRA